jgi:hypothetical protein
VTAAVNPSHRRKVGDLTSISELPTQLPSEMDPYGGLPFLTHPLKGNKFLVTTAHVVNFILKPGQGTHTNKHTLSQLYWDLAALSKLTALYKHMHIVFLHHTTILDKAIYLIDTRLTSLAPGKDLGSYIYLGVGYDCFELTMG